MKVSLRTPSALTVLDANSTELHSTGESRTKTGPPDLRKRIPRRLSVGSEYFTTPLCASFPFRLQMAPRASTGQMSSMVSPRTTW